MRFYFRNTTWFFIATGILIFCFTFATQCCCGASFRAPSSLGEALKSQALGSTEQPGDVRPTPLSHAPRCHHSTAHPILLPCAALPRSLSPTPSKLFVHLPTCPLQRSFPTEPSPAHALHRVPLRQCTPALPTSLPRRSPPTAPRNGGPSGGLSTGTTSYARHPAQCSAGWPCGGIPCCSTAGQAKPRLLPRWHQRVPDCSGCTLCLGAGSTPNTGTMFKLTPNLSLLLSTQSSWK